MNAFWKTISYGGFLALWLQSSQCLPSSHHSQEDKEQKRIDGSVSSVSSPRAMDINSEESDSESSIVISEVPNFQEVLNRLDRDENSSIFTTRKSDPLSPELNAQQDLEPMRNSRITTINSEPKKLEENSSPSEITSFLTDYNPLRDFFQEHMESFFPDNSKDEEEKTYMTKIFSKTLKNISAKERDDAVVFLIEKNISPKIIEKLFHLPQYMIEAFKICPPLDPDENYENRKKKAIELLKENIPILKISYIVHIDPTNIKNIANKEGIFIKERKKNIDYSAIPQNLLLEIDGNSLVEEKKRRVISLLEYNVPVYKIEKIAHVSSDNIAILARQNGIATRQRKNTFQASNEIKKYMVTAPEDTTMTEKEKRALFLLDNKVPMISIAKILHVSFLKIKQLAEKHGIAIRKTAKAFQAPDEIKEYMAEMPKDAIREEKEKRALILLENKVPMIKIQEIIHMATFDIKKLGEKHGIAIRKNRQTFQTPDEIKEYMIEMPHDAPREEKEKRALILLEHKVPVKKIQEISHMTNFNIKKLAEKHSITLRKTAKAFQVPDEIKEYMVEMPQDATREKKEKRVLFLLENKVPIIRIASIVHMAFFDIEKFAEKHGITHRKYVKTFQAPDEIEEYMVGMPHDAPREEKEKRALFLLENKVPMDTITSIVHMASFNIKKFAEKYGITIRESKKTFEVPDEIKEYMVEMPQNATREEKEKRALFLLENKVPLTKIGQIVHMDLLYIKKLAEKYGITTRQSEQAFQVPDVIKEYMVEMPKDAPSKEKEKHALILLEHKVPIKQIQQIVHKNTFDIKKLAEKHGFTIRQSPKTFQVPDEIEEYMNEMPRNTPREEKEKRALFLLDNKVPLTKIGQIVHIAAFDIKKLAEKHGVAIRQSSKTFQVSDEIEEYMNEMPQNATREEKEKRALFLLENKVPIKKIEKIVHISRKVIKQLAEKYQITTRECKKY